MTHKKGITATRGRHGSNGAHHAPRTTIGIKTSTKKKLDKNRAPGQCYNGFICQMVDTWEKTSGNGRK